MKKLGMVVRLIMMVGLLGTGLLSAQAQQTGRCVIFDGIEHCPLSETSLTPSGRNLLHVSPLVGSSAPFGVTIHPNGQRAWDGKFEPVALSGQSRMDMRFMGNANGVEEEIGKLATVSTPGSSQKAMYADFSLMAPASAYTIRGYQNNTVVFTRTGVVPQQVTRLNPQTNAPELWWIVALYVLDHASAHVDYSQSSGWSGGVDWNSSNIVDVGGDGTGDFTGDKLMITPERQISRTRTLSSIQLQATGIQRFTIKNGITDGGCILWPEPFWHCPRGGGRLSTSSNGTELYVDNLGSSGQDGVSISTPGGTSWETHFAPVRLGSQGRMMVTAYGQSANGPTRIGHIITQSRPDLGQGRKGLYVDWSPLKAQRYGLRGYDNGTLVFSRTITPQPGQMELDPTLQFPIIPILIGIYVLDHASAHVEYSQSSGWSGGVDWNSNSVVDVDGDGTGDFTGDKLMVVPQATLLPATTLDSISISTINVPRLVMRPIDPLRCFEWLLRQLCALGQAEISSASSPTGQPEINVSSVGSSGQDGISFDVDADDTFKATWVFPHVLETSGARMALALAGPSGGGGADEVLAASTIAYTSTSGQFDLSADFSGMGSPEVQVTAYRRGIVSYTEPRMIGGRTLASVSSMPSGGEVECYGCLSYSWGISNPTWLTVPGRAPIEIDEWVVKPAPTALKAPPVGLNAIRLMLTNIDELNVAPEFTDGSYKLFMPMIMR